jgi:sugar O-acyltransferase (sialic acid O-acetyltransferase NeuD family)
MIKDIVIIGSGGHAKEIAFLIEEINLNEKEWNLLGYIDKESVNIGKVNGHYSVIGNESFFMKYRSKIDIVVAIGSPMIVKNVVERLSKEFPNTLDFPNIVHPSVQPNLRDVSIGTGNIICAGNIFTTDISIGSFNCFNRGCNISHDTKIENYCTINPGVNISGGVKIESTCLIGTGATILQYLTIGKNAIVGAGAVVTKDVEKGKTVIGIPAKPIN